jgi:branched-chain amino acid aminotransferase
LTLKIETITTENPKKKPDPKTYGFGKFFSDHMFCADYSGGKWSSHRVIPYQTIAIDPGAAVLHYGQAIFEGMKAFKGKDGKIRLFRPLMNWERFTASAERLCMQPPDQETFIEGIKALVHADADWIPSQTGQSLYLRPTLIGTESFLGVRPAEKYLFYVVASPVGSYYGEGLDSVKIWIERGYSRAAPGGIGSTKAGGNYAASLKAAVEAKKRGYAQVLWTDAAQHKLVEEVGTMNVFFVVGDKVLTPNLSGTILPGVMRDSTIQVLKSFGVTVEERPVDLADILAAHKSGQLKEVFGTGTAAQISPVSELGSAEQTYKIGNGEVGPLSRKLYSYFMDLNYGGSPDQFGWLTEI